MIGAPIGSAIGAAFPDNVGTIITAGASTNTSGTAVTPALDLSLAEAMSGDGIGLASAASLTPANDTDLADSMTQAGIGSTNSDTITRN